MKILFFSLAFIEKHKRLSRIRGELVEFKSIKVSHVLLCLLLVPPPLTCQLMLNVQRNCVAGVPFVLQCVAVFCSVLQCVAAQGAPKPLSVLWVHTHSALLTPSIRGLEKRIGPSSQQVWGGYD